MGEATKDLSTRDRLIEAAGQLFAGRGYEETSIREIAEAAGANVAAINYHFRGKENLYREVIRERAAACCADRMAFLAPALEAGQSPDLERVLGDVVRLHISRLFQAQGPDRDIALFFREISTPGPGFDIMMEEMIGPTHYAMCEILMRAVPGLSQHKATLCITSLFGQMVHFVRARVVVSRLTGEDYTKAFLDEITDHVVRFSLAGIRDAGEGT